VVYVAGLRLKLATALSAIDALVLDVVFNTFRVGDRGPPGVCVGINPAVTHETLTQTAVVNIFTLEPLETRDAPVHVAPHLRVTVGSQEGFELTRFVDGVVVTLVQE
jgi:hypothetical protein